MGKKRVLQKSILVFSGMAFWGLLMPATILGIMISIVIFMLLLKESQILTEKNKTKGGWLSVAYIIAAFLYAVLFYNFKQQWILSGKVRSVAVKMGMSIDTLVGLTGVGAIIISLYFIISIIRILHNGRDYEILDSISDNIIKLNIQDIIVCGAIAVIFGFELATNPWSNGYPGTDSAVFLYIGKQMREGLIPYTDLFDHKGIILYFIEYLGMTISAGKFWGVWLFEIAGLILTALFILKISLLFNESKNAGYIAAFVTLFAFSGYLSIEGGNVVEEYALPWITIALYICVKFFLRNTYRKWDIVGLGICFTIVLFLRQNMITVWIAFLPIIFLYLIYKKRFSELGECIFLFIVGCAIVCVPLIGYFVKNESLQRMVECYFLFNFGYSDGKNGIVGILNSAAYLITKTPLGMMAVLVPFKKCMKKPIWILNMFFLLVSVLLASMSGRSYEHYGIMLIPALIIPVIALINWMEKELFGSVKFKSCLVTGSAMVVLVVIVVLNRFGYYPVEMTEAAVFMKENTLPEDDVLVLGNNCRYYLESERSTNNRFFYQTPPIDVSETLYMEFIEELHTEKPDCIVVTGKKNSAENGNYGKLLQELAGLEQKGVYSSIEFDSFYTYIKN